MSFEERIDGMYSNLGGKIKKFARGWFVLMSALSVIAGVIFPFVALVEGWDVDGLLPFMISLVLSPIAVVTCIAVFYVSSWPIYWAGELLEKVCKIEESQCGVVMEEKPKTQPHSDQVERLKALGKEIFKSVVSVIKDSTAQKPNPTTAVKRETSNKEWECEYCFNKNPADTTRCKNCGEARSR